MAVEQIVFLKLRRRGSRKRRSRQGISSLIRAPCGTVQALLRQLAGEAGTAGKRIVMAAIELREAGLIRVTCPEPIGLSGSDQRPLFAFPGIQSARNRTRRCAASLRSPPWRRGCQNGALPPMRMRPRGAPAARTLIRAGYTKRRLLPSLCPWRSRTSLGSCLRAARGCR